MIQETWPLIGPWCSAYEELRKELRRVMRVVIVLESGVGPWGTLLSAVPCMMLQLDLVDLRPLAVSWEIWGWPSLRVALPLPRPFPRPSPSLLRPQAPSFAIELSALLLASALRVAIAIAGSANQIVVRQGPWTYFRLSQSRILDTSCFWCANGNYHFRFL